MIGCLWLVSLAAAAAAASAQARSYTPLTEPRVFAGADVGFRVTGMHGTEPAGTIVVRINGAWVEARVEAGPRLIR